MILQKYDFSSKSQPINKIIPWKFSCLWYCKSTIFQANHNRLSQDRRHRRLFVILQKYDFSSKSQPNHSRGRYHIAVCDTAKVRFFKQITTKCYLRRPSKLLFVILQKYDFSSKSQLQVARITPRASCLWYCKSTIFQANHNVNRVVQRHFGLFVILQKYDFSSKSQHKVLSVQPSISCLWYCKSTIFQANHNNTATSGNKLKLFVILQKYDFSSKSQRTTRSICASKCCLWYCKSTIFQANHNMTILGYRLKTAVCDTAKVRFFKQITT